MVEVDLKETDVINKAREQMIMAIRNKIFVLLQGLEKSSNKPSKIQNPINARYSYKSMGSICSGLNLINWNEEMRIRMYFVNLKMPDKVSPHFNNR